MGKNIWPVIFLMLALTACNGKSSTQQASKLADAYAGITSKYDRLNAQLNGKIKSIFSCTAPSAISFSMQQMKCRVFLCSL